MIENSIVIFRQKVKRQIPLQWRETAIKSLYKGGGIKEKNQENQRELSC